jgi:uncharacterized protein
MAMEDKLKNRRRFTKLLMMLAGHVSLGLGLLGIVLPLLPTTPFVLLAAACYMRGSESLYNWLMNQRLLGPYIAKYRAGGGVGRRLKVGLIALIWITITISAMGLFDSVYIRLILFGIAAIVSLVIWRLR